MVDGFFLLDIVVTFNLVDIDASTGRFVFTELTRPHKKVSTRPRPLVTPPEGELWRARP